MSTPLSIRLPVWLWLIAAILAGQFRLLAHIPAPAVQGILLALTALLLLVYFKVPSLRAWVDGLDLRALVLLHVTRFVGCYFLLLYQRGELPYAYAVPGGWGDNLVAALAVLVSVLPMKVATRRHAIAIWNTIGLLEMLLFVFTACQLGLQSPWLMKAFTHLPLSLLPTFLLPLLLGTHVIIYLRMAREQKLPAL
ncbi:MAG: hypothetical protein PHQ04_07395 [Opitutaceae bacterium]|nr:hypothetical protein [Opitutaceae bacterium]